MQIVEYLTNYEIPTWLIRFVLFTVAYQTFIISARVSRLSDRVELMQRDAARLREDMKRDLVAIYNVSKERKSYYE